MEGKENLIPASNAISSWWDNYQKLCHKFINSPIKGPQLFYKITSNEKKKTVFTKKTKQKQNKKKSNRIKMCMLSECNMDL